MVAKQYKKPDLNAPRYRPRKLNLTNTEFYNKFIEENPKFNQITIKQFKEIIKTFNGKIWEKVIEERDGVQLPEQIGYLFIGSCPRKKSNVDFNKSQHYGVVLQNQNWESDQYLAKIFYTNYETKYRFKNHELWGFKGVRDFTRTVGQTYPTEWKKYIQMDNMIKASRLFRKHKIDNIKKIERIDLLKDYDEFNLD
jgi:hypothetical protein